MVARSLVGFVRACGVAATRARLDRALGFVLAVSCGTAAAAGVTTIDFDGSLPPGTELTRASAALGAGDDGAVVASDVPRFQVGAFSPGAAFVRSLPQSDRVLASTLIGGVQYSLVRLGETPALTTGEPGSVPAPVYTYPHGSVIGNFSGSPAVWGFANTAEILPDGSVILHTGGAGPERRAMTLRTTLASFADPGGFEVVRVSDWVPPAGTAPSNVDAAAPRRSLYLPHLGVWASAITEYVSEGMGRDLGYASIDGGHTWQRVIDSELDVPDRILEPLPKHMHHVEPFEWFDASSSTWKIGVIALLGDKTPAPPQQGQVVARAHGAALPDLAGETYASVARLKALGVDQLTDLFPLNSSGTPSEGPVFLGGTDGRPVGIASMTLHGDTEADAVRFRSTVTLARQPFVLQLGRLGNGAIAAPSGIFTGTYRAEGIWVSDADGLHWATAYMPRHIGFRGVLPVGTQRFWTLSAREDRAYFEQSLWEVPGPPTLRSSILLEPSALDVPVAPAFASSGSVSTTVVSGVPAPPRIGANHEILRVRSESLSQGQAFDALTPQTVSAAAGQLVQLSFWVEPVPPDLAVAPFRTSLELISAGGASTFSESVPVELDLSDWTRIVVSCRVPAAGTARAVAHFALDEDASASRPLDYYVSEPQLVVSDQPTIAPYRRAATTAGDHLTLHLPPLQSHWSIAVWATEAPNLVLSLLGPAGTQALVQQTAVPTERTAFALSSAVAFSFGSPSAGTVQAGQVATRDVVVPTQDLVVITRSGRQLKLYVSRGMGPVETLARTASFDFAPTELRFGTAAWDRLFEGTVQRVRIWDDVALDAAAVEAARSTLPVSNDGGGGGGGGGGGPIGCGMLGIEGFLLLPPLHALQRRRAKRGEV